MRKRVVPFPQRRGLQVWPDGARFAIGLYAAIEEWDEEAMVAAQSPPPLGPGLLPNMLRADLAITSHIEYAYRVGIWRLMEVWTRHDVRVSLVANALAAERHPDVLRELLRQGHDLVSHGYEQSRPFTELSEREQVEHIERCIRTFEEVTGTRPPGWGSPRARQYQRTLELLAERGFAFHQGLHDDELPYVLDFGGKSMIEIPHRITESGEANDYQLYNPRDCRVGDEIIAYCKSIIGARHVESETRPQMTMIGMHPEVSGRPDRAQALSRVLDYVKSLPGVWLTTPGQIAQWWAKNCHSLPLETI
jgi:chitin deacetylase